MKLLDYNSGMMWGNNDGGNWLWIAAMMVVILGVIIGLTVFAIRSFSGPNSNDQAMDLLRRRLAGGEINPEEFEKTRQRLA